MIPFAIIDVEFDELVEDLDVGLAVWRCTATLEDGSQLEGTIIGDGISAFDAESFEPDES